MPSQNRSDVYKCKAEATLPKDAALFDDVLPKLEHFKVELC